METYGSRHHLLTAACLACLLLGFATLSGCRSLRGGNGAASQTTAPPVPQQPSSTLKLPEAISSEAAKGQASVPENVKLGFALDLNEKLIGGNWDIQATVASFDDRVIAFRTDKGETGRLAYRLPEGLHLTLRPGQNIAIKRDAIGYEVSMGYQLTIASDGNPLLAAGQLIGPTPLEVKFLKEPIMRQDDKRKTVLSENERETIYQVPVMISGGNGEAAVGKLTELKVGGASFTVLVRESTLTVPTKEKEGVAEGSGYRLEYAATQNNQQPPPTEPKN